MFLLGFFLFSKYFLSLIRFYSFYQKENSYRYKFYIFRKLVLFKVYACTIGFITLFFESFIDEQNSIAVEIIDIRIKLIICHSVMFEKIFQRYAKIEFIFLVLIYNAFSDMIILGHFLFLLLSYITPWKLSTHQDKTMCNSFWDKTCK